MGGAAPLISSHRCSDGWGGRRSGSWKSFEGCGATVTPTALIAPQHSRSSLGLRQEGFKVHAVRFGNKGHLPSWVRLFG